MDHNILQLQDELAKKQQELDDLKAKFEAASNSKPPVPISSQWPLSQDEYNSYSRQMIVPGFGLEGQLKVKNSKVLIIGAGGLGCPAAAYLAGAGVGTIGLADGDVVEQSNLHRQIAHSQATIGMRKVDSAVMYLSSLNPLVKYKTYPEHLNPQNAEGIFSDYNIILDCTDHPASRYLISDVAVLLSKPLISASAFQTSGQLIVLNSPPSKGPCYRCVFPKPPPPESVTSCGEGGILGPVVGTMGVMQALEALKIILKSGVDVGGGEEEASKTMMLLFSGMDSVPFRSVRMRGKRKDCFACGDAPGLTLRELKTSMDYVQFCGIVKPVKILSPEDRISVEDYHKVVKGRIPHILLDVREKEPFGMAALEKALNIPISLFARRKVGHMPDWIAPEMKDEAETPIYVICRVGNDSQIAAKALKDLGLDGNGKRFIGDIEGGLMTWKERIDPSLPFV